MTEGSTGDRMVVGVDGSPGGRAALVWALAAAARAGAEVEVVSAFPVDLSWLAPDLLDPRRVEEVRSDTEARLRVSVAEAMEDPTVRGTARDATVPVHVTVVPGDPAEALVARAEDAGLLVVGSRGRGAVQSALLGSVALHCAAHAPCPVVVVHPGPTAAPRVVVGIDDSSGAHADLQEAVAHARRLGARVEAVLVCQPVTYWSDATAPVPPVGESVDAARARAERMVTAALGPGPHPDVEVVVEVGAPGDVLVRRSAGAGLLVVGSRSRSGLAGLALGSVALHCVVHASCPVLVVRHGRAHAATSAAEAASPAHG